MAVFTAVTPAEAGALTERLGAGALLQLQGIGAGIENTNFFVTTTQGDWVLTLFERLTADQLPYYLRLMQHLAQRGLPVPEPRAAAAGQILHQVAGKPAALVNRLPGHHQLAPDLHHCAQLGGLLARMHLAVADFPLQQPNLRGSGWWHNIAPAQHSRYRAKAPRVRHSARVLLNRACSAPWPPQCTSAGACQNGTDNSPARPMRTSMPCTRRGSASRASSAGDGLPSAPAAAISRCSPSKVPPSTQSARVITTMVPTA